MKYECAPTSTGAHFAIYAKASHQSYSRRKIMTKKKKILLIVLLLVLGCAFIGIGVLVTSSTMADSNNQRARTSEGTHKAGNREGAESLIDQTVSREEIQETVGEWEDFELDGNGCERGVYAGRFYYENFILYSRTYDKGETFHVMSIYE